MESKVNVNLQNELNDWSNKMASKKLPRWNELPEFEVYMDQVIMLMDKYVSAYFEHTPEPFLTPSMINNYVKLKIIPAPNKKKYSRIHLSYLIIICMLKSVISIQDIHDIIEYKVSECGIDKTLDWFTSTCEEQFNTFISTSSLLSGIKDKNKTDISNEAFRMGIDASIARNISSTLIYEIKKEDASLQGNKTSKVKEEK